MSELTLAINLDKRQYLASDKFPHPRHDELGQCQGIGSMDKVLTLLMEGCDKDCTTDCVRRRSRKPTEEEERSQRHIYFVTTRSGEHFETPVDAGGWAGDRIVIVNQHVASRRYMTKAMQLRALAIAIRDKAAANTAVINTPFVADASKARRGKHGISQYPAATQTWIFDCTKDVTIFNYARKYWTDISLSVHDQLAEFGLSRSSPQFYKTWLREQLAEALLDYYTIASERNVAGMLGMKFDLYWMRPQLLAKFLRQYTSLISVKNVKTWLRKQILTQWQREIINKYKQFSDARWNDLVNRISDRQFNDGTGVRLLPRKEYMDAALELSAREDSANLGSATAAIMRELTGNVTSRRVIQIDDKESIDAESTPDTVDPE